MSSIEYNNIKSATEIGCKGFETKYIRSELRHIKDSN